MARRRDGGQGREPHPQAAQIRAQNAARIARRREAAILAGQFAQTEASDLSRFGDTREVGGRFETMQKVPLGRKIRPDRGGLTMADIQRFLAAFQFAPQQRQVRPTRSRFVSVPRTGWRLPQGFTRTVISRF